MVRTRLALLATAMLFALACATSTPPSKFTGLENEWVAAIRDHDTAVLDRLLDDSFVDTTYRGALRTKSEVLGGPPAGGPYRTVRLDDVAVRMYRDHTAVVTGVNVLQGTSEQDVVRVRFTDVFVLRGKSWRAVSAQETLQATSPPG